MHIASEKVELILEFQKLDETLGYPREVETEELFQLIDVLKEEATFRSNEIFTHLMQSHHPDRYPWSTIRVMEFPEDLPANARDYERDIVRAPPLLVLLLGRRFHLEPEKSGDEVAIDAPQWRTLWSALTDWSPAQLKQRIGENGWKQRENIVLPGPSPKPWTPPITKNPVIPRPPIPDPPFDPAPPVEPEPPLDVDTSPPEPEPLPPEDSQPTEDDPEFAEPEDSADDELDETNPDEPPPVDWKTVGKTAAWTVGVGALAYWLGKSMSA